MVDLTSLPDNVEDTPLLSRTTNKTAGVHPDPEFKFNYNLAEAPRGQKLLILTRGKVTTNGYIGSLEKAQQEGIIAWHLFPSRDYELEAQLGL